MNRHLLVAFVLIGSSLGCNAETSSGSGAGSRDTFIAQICEQYMPCCTKAGKPSDGAQCRSFYGAFAASATYDAAAADKCLAEIKGQASSPTFCDDGMSSSKAPSCNGVFNAGSTGTKKPGETCESDDDCAPSAEGQVECRSVFTSGATIKKCQLQIVGKAGDGPCLGTVDGNMTSYNSSGDTDVQPRGYLCNVASGLRCDGTTDKCTAIPKLGEACTSSGSYSCTKDAYCDSTAKQCVARKTAGATCDGFSEQCADGTYCDNATKKCTTSLAIGAPCTSSMQCASKSCVNSACAAPGGSLTTAFLCGG